MFTEQPAPPNLVHVQPAQTEVVTKAQPAPVEPATHRVAPPEPIAPPAPTPQPAVEQPATNSPSTGNYGKATATDSPPPTAPTRSTAPEANSATLSVPEEAKAKRRQEVEQTLLEITNKARAEQKEAQQQQAATEAAKYGEAGDFKQAEQAAKNPALPASLRQRLLKQLQAKQAKQKGAIAAKAPGKTTARGSQTSSTTTSQVAPPEYTYSGREGYASTPIIPLSEAELRVRYGKLIGRNLDFAYPLTTPAPVTSLFGWRIHPISGSSRFHRGIDLGAPYGTPVVAAKTGRVEMAGDMSGYGLTVMLRHTTSQQTLYAHLSQIYVKPGEMVKKGQLLGLVGSTGNSTGPHLHFELHQLTSEGWTALDPAIVLNSAIALAQNPSVPTLTRGKPQAFNLALSGLLDINAPAVVEFPLPLKHPLVMGVSDFVSAALTRAPEPFRPFTLLPTVLPELNWLLSPFANNWLTSEQTMPLPGLEDPTPTLSLTPMPTLAGNLSTPSGSQSAIANVSQSVQRQLAMTDPLPRLAGTEKILNAVRLEALKQPTSRPMQTASKQQILTQTALKPFVKPESKPLPPQSQVLLSLSLKQKPVPQSTVSLRTISQQRLTSLPVKPLQKP